MEQTENLKIHRLCAFQSPHYPLPCSNYGTQCGMCACSGPCIHEANPVCEHHAGFIEGWIEAVPVDEETDPEGLNRTAEAAVRFIRLIHPTFTPDLER